MKRSVLVVSALVFLALAASVVAETSPWETLEWGRMNTQQRFTWSLDLFRMGRAEDAAGALKRVIDAGPDARTVIACEDAMGPDVRKAMLENEATVKAAQEWVALYEKSIHELRRDDAFVKSVVDKLTGTGDDVDMAMRRIDALAEYAAPHVIRLLADSQNAGVRVTCRKALIRLDRAAVLPVVECLHSPDNVLKVTLLDILGELRDARSQAMVTQLAIDTQASPAVRKTATTTLLKILHQPQPALELSKTATVNYWRLADAYLHDADFTLPTMEGPQLPVWTWDDAKGWVAYRLVPRALYNEELAEEACFDGLAVDKNDRSLRALAIAVYFAEKLELLGVRAPEVDRKIDMALLVGGKQALADCLGKALDDGDLGIAIQAAQALGKVGQGKGFTVLELIKNANPLLVALENDDRAVRFAAARAIVACQPANQPVMALPGRPEGEEVIGGRFDNYGKVIPALGWGLMYELPQRTVLVMHPDQGTVNYYKDLLKKRGLAVLDATTVAGGMARAAALPRPDVVLLAQAFLPALEGLRGMLGTDRIPVVVIADAEGETPGVEGVLQGRATEDSVKLVLARVIDVPEKKLVEGLIPHISARAAEALAQVMPDASPLPVRTAADALVRAIKSRDDAVRIGALEALGHIAVGRTSPDVLLVAADRGSAKPVRLAALTALAAILQEQESVSPELFDDLVPISGETDPEISLAAARAIAVAKFDEKQFADLMVLKRVKEIQAGRP